MVMIKPVPDMYVQKNGGIQISPAIIMVLMVKDIFLEIKTR